MNGDELKRRRNALGISQEGLAHLLGVTRQSVYSWERGIRRVPKMLDWALQAIESEKSWIDLREAMYEGRVRRERDTGGDGTGDDAL